MSERVNNPNVPEFGGRSDSHFGLSGTALKWIAMITMTIDHTAEVLVPFSWSLSPYLIMRIIGRIAFPIYAFLLVEGFHHTQNRGRYAFRLGLFAILSEIPFNLAVGGTLRDINHQNVFITLFLGMLMLWCIDMLREKWQVPQPEKGESYLAKISGDRPLRSLLILLIVAGFMLLADFMQTDYSSTGIVLIAFMGLVYPTNLLKKILTAGVALCVWLGNPVQMLAAVSFICPVGLYNGTRGKTNRVMQWIFYLYYPVHLLILVGLKYWIG